MKVWCPNLKIVSYFNMVMYVGFCQYIDEIFLAYERGDFKLSINLVQVYFDI